jgi:UDP-2,3-diacylglucosamine pyrophosphatase LpxH
MKDPNDARGRLLQELIAAAMINPPKHFVLLGDIFDFCLGSTPYFKTKFAPIGEALSKLADLGTEVTFFEGNHEFELPKLSWRGVQFVGVGSKDFVLPMGQVVRAAHGDLVYSTLGYRLFRGFLKSWLVRFLCTYIVPSRMLDAYALSHAKVSRASDSYRTLNHQALMTDVTCWIGPETSIGLIGHFHTPYYEQLSEGQALLSVKDWSTPNFLVLKDNSVWRGIHDGQVWQLDTAKQTHFLMK